MKTQNPWMGRARGSAGNMTSSKVYDKNVMRAKAFEVNNPKTAAQTNERNFFADAQKVCQTVSEEQLRSLFGVKPKSKSRRNALLSQLLEAFSINDGVKEFDFSKLEAIGNGKKIEVQIQPLTTATSPIWDFSENPGLQEMPLNANYIVIGFNEDNNSIQIFNTEIAKEVGDEDIDIDSLIADNKFNGFVYVTYATSGTNVSDKPFGSFTLKTRAV